LVWYFNKKWRDKTSLPDLTIIPGLQRYTQSKNYTNIDRKVSLSIEDERNI